MTVVAALALALIAAPARVEAKKPQNPPQPPPPRVATVMTANPPVPLYAASMAPFHCGLIGCLGWHYLVSARLTDVDGNGVGGRTVWLSLGSDSCGGRTDATGTASCTAVSERGPASSLHAWFSGDETYAPSEDWA